MQEDIAVSVPRPAGSAAARGAFIAGVVACCTPWVSPPLALALGIAIALTVGNPYRARSAKATKYLLQISVAVLGFGMNFGEVATAGKTGVLVTAVSIFGTLGAGWLLGRWLGVGRTTSHLISAGTAICGGSAIAAVAPILDADEKEISVSLGTVFILNSVALFLFPPIGRFLGLTQHQFGLWSAVAIHDTSSVVGAAARYGAEALKVATTVKLTRALWIIPLSLLAAFAFKNRNAKVTFPHFILAFVGASIVVTLLPGLKPVYGALVGAGRTGLTLTLFLIGAGLSRETLKSVGVRPALQGTLLWVVVSTVSLLAVTGVF